MANKQTPSAPFNPAALPPDAAFFDRIRAGDVGAVKNVLHTRKGAAGWQQTSNGQSGLHVAAMTGHRKIAAELVKAGAAVEARDHLGRTPLAQAARSGQHNLVDFLLLQKADIHAQDKSGQARGYRRPCNRRRGAGRIRVAAARNGTRYRAAQTPQSPQARAALIGGAKPVLRGFGCVKRFLSRRGYSESISALKRRFGIFVPEISVGNLWISPEGLEIWDESYHIFINKKPFYPFCVYAGAAGTTYVFRPEIFFDGICATFVRNGHGSR